MTAKAVPQGWTLTRLGDLIDGFEAGRNLRASGRPASDAEYGVLKISAVSWGRFKPEENKALLPGDAPRPHETIRSGDLLISRANTTELVGAVVRVGEDYPRLMLPDKVLRLRVRTALVDPSFLLHALRRDEARKHLEANATGTSDSMRNLSQPKMEAVPVALPPLNEQRRIVAKLESLQIRSRRAREALEAVPPLLEKLRQSILASAFRGDLTKDWRAKHPEVEPANEQLKDTRRTGVLRRGVPDGVAVTDVVRALQVPRSWRKVSIAELLGRGVLVDVKDGNHGANHPRTSDFVDDGLPFVMASHVRNWTVAYHEAPKIAGEPLKKLQVGFARPGDVIFTHKGTIGRVGFCTRDCVLTPQTTYYRVNPDVLDPHFLMYQLASFPFSAQYALIMSQTTRNYVPISEQYRLFLLVPPLEEQQQIGLRLKGLIGSTEALSSRSATFRASLASLEASILVMAFSGKLVPQHPNEEPADAVLARLRGADDAIRRVTTVGATIKAPQGATTGRGNLSSRTK